MKKPLGIQFENLTFGYDQNPVLKDISLEARQGEITVLFGPSGAGKSTCLRLIAGLEKPQAGKLNIGNMIIDQTNNVYPHQRDIGFCFQEPALWEGLQVYSHIDLPLRTISLSNQERAAKITEILERFDLNHLASRKPHELSGGEQKRLSFARALSTDPSTILLDEPLSSVEKKRREEMIQLIRDLKQPGRTIILVTHHWEEVEALADKIVIIIDGQVVQCGNFAHVFQHPISRHVAELMGYSYFFPVWESGYKRITPHGEWLRENSSSISWGTISNRAIECIPCSEGEFTVQDCRWLGKQYRVELRGQGYCLILESPHKWERGEKAKLLLREQPIWIEK